MTLGQRIVLAIECKVAFLTLLILEYIAFWIIQEHAGGNDHFRTAAFVAIQASVFLISLGLCYPVYRHVSGTAPDDVKPPWDRVTLSDMIAPYRTACKLFESAGICLII